MTPEQAREAAGLLRTARRTCRPAAYLPPHCRPGDLEEAYAVQAAFLARTGPNDPALEPRGYKLACTSPKAQAALAVDTPLVGRLLAGSIHRSPATLSACRFPFRLIEPEFAFAMGADLPPRDQAYGEAEVAEAVARLHPAFEVVTSAFGEPAWWRAGAPSLAADNAVHGALVLGQGTADWRGLDLPGHPVRLSINGTSISEGVGANALGGPLTALTWLANKLATAPDRIAGSPGLRAGEVVTTGVVTDFKLLDAGDDAIADFGPLGQVRVHFVD